MVNFSEQNYKRSSELFDIAAELHKLLDDVATEINKKQLQLSALENYKKSSLYFFVAAFKSFSAIHILCREGYGQDSSVVLRSLMENLISLKYILIGDRKNRNERAERFVEYRWVELKRLIDYWENHAFNDALKEKVMSKKEEVYETAAAFKKRYKAKDLSTWAGISIRKMAEEVYMLEEYLLAYRLCCSFSHPSFIGLLERTDRVGDDVMFSSNPSFRGIIEDMKSAISFMMQFLILFDKIFDLKMTSEIKAFEEKTLRIFEMEKYKQGLELE